MSAASANRCSVGQRPRRCQVESGSGRNAADAQEFIADLASRLKHRVQLTSDGHRPYLDAVEQAFGADVDYAMLVKLYGSDQENERRYSPAQCIGAVPTVITGRPDPDHISTSFVERQNWSVRMSMRRYTRLSNGFSRKIENHMAAVAINYFAYNCIKVHRTLRVSPALEAGVTNRLFDVIDLIKSAAWPTPRARTIRVRARQGNSVHYSCWSWGSYP